jgi:hypothetical protein
MRMPVMGIRIMVMNMRDRIVLMPMRMAGPRHNLRVVTMIMV